jgi:Zn-finger in ubiquitin-hydrolases and other protein
MSGKEFLLLQELPDFEEAVKRAEASLKESSLAATVTTTTVGAAAADADNNQNGSCGRSGSSDQGTGTVCCLHLRRYLPAKLDLTLIPIASNSHKWMLSDPVSALHLASQLESPTDGFVALCEGEPVLYGEEQERWMTACAQGFPDTWHPWIQPLSPPPPPPKHQPQQPPQRSLDHGPTSAAAAILMPPPPALALAAVPTPMTNSSLPTTTSNNNNNSSSSMSSTSPVPPPLPPFGILPAGTGGGPMNASLTGRQPLGLAPPPASSSSLAMAAPLAPPSASVTHATSTTTTVHSSNSTTAVASLTLTQQEQLAQQQQQQQHYADWKFLSLNAAQDAIAQVRREFLAKRPSAAHKKRLLESQKGQTVTAASMLDSASPNTAPANAQQQPSQLSTNKIKRNKTAEYNQTPPSTLLQMPAWKQYEPLPRSTNTNAVQTAEQHEMWLHQSRRAVAMVEVWMERFRQSRLRYWRERSRDESELPPPIPAVGQTARKTPVSLRSELSPTSVFGAMESSTRRPQDATPLAAPPHNEFKTRLSCQECVRPLRETKTAWFPYNAVSMDNTTPQPKPLVGDDLMQCLECSHVGCAPATACGSRTDPASQQHALQHFLTSRHCFGA